MHRNCVELGALIFISNSEDLVCLSSKDEQRD